MASKIISIDQYLAEGCGRCKYFQSPKCKVHKWTDELQMLRSIVLTSGLIEELKWSMPCYTRNEMNIVMVAAMKDYCTISFFKGTLLTDAKKVLISPGANSNANRQLRFTSVQQIIQLKGTILKYIKEAIAIEESGKKLELSDKKEDPIIPELIEEFKKNLRLKSAFYQLTPGRQRGYLIYFSGAKQSATRLSRIQKHSAKILAGKGFHD